MEERRGASDAIVQRNQNEPRLHAHRALAKLPIGEDVEKKVVVVVLRFKPDRHMSRVGERPMRAELVRAVMDLVRNNVSSGVEL